MRIVLEFLLKYQNELAYLNTCHKKEQKNIGSDNSYVLLKIHSFFGRSSEDLWRQRRKQKGLAGVDKVMMIEFVKS